MNDRVELLEAALDSLPQGLALLGADSRVAFWNQAAHAITGYAALDVVGRPALESLISLLDPSAPMEQAGQHPGHGFLVHAFHKLGHEVPAMARHFQLRDDLGKRIGIAVLFHQAECMEALPQGLTGENEAVEASQEDLKERLESLFEDFVRGAQPFGVLWITVDQAHDLRKTHGKGACEAMFQKIERTLIHGLRPSEHMGRWGEDEFLVLSHERTSALLADHAKTLAGMARTTDFRWWGDRISVTVSIGAAQALTAATLVDLLERARAAMSLSLNAGGNQITASPEGHTCSPS
jgi:diguanylate cyclase (GGDEF)-like protein/PAS domain S-box-containing protein